jgi:hypothetical protein
MLSIFDHVLFGKPAAPGFYDSSLLVRAMPILRRIVVITLAVASAVSSGSLRLAVLSLFFAVIDALVYRRLLLLGGLTQHPNATDTPLVLVPSDSPRRCIFEHGAALRAGHSFGVPATLTSHPNRALVVSGAPIEVPENNETKRQLWYHRTFIGAKPTAVTMRIDGSNVLLVKQTDDGPRSLVLCIEDNIFRVGHHILALGNAHDESTVQYDDPWPTFSGFARTFQRTDGRLFIINSNDTISPAGAPHLVLGLRTALPVATGEAARTAPARRTSSISSLGSLALPLSLVEKMSQESFSHLHEQQADDLGRWLLDALKFFSLQLGETLQDIEMRQACCEAEQAAADELPAPGLDQRKTRSDLHYSSLDGEAHVANEEVSPIRIRARGDMNAYRANALWESACHETLERCDTLMQAMSRYSSANQEALVRAFRAYIPETDEDQIREALVQTEALRAFGEAIKAALRATESERVSEPVPPPHPMRGTPLPDVLHSGVLTRKNAFGSLFKAKQKKKAEVAAHPDCLRDFDLSHNVERCDIFLSHSWGAQDGSLHMFALSVPNQCPT